MKITAVETIRLTEFANLLWVRIHTDEGLVAAQRIRDNHPDVAVLVLSQYVEPAYAMRLLDTDEIGRRAPW